MSTLLAQVRLIIVYIIRSPGTADKTVYDSWHQYSTSSEGTRRWDELGQYHGWTGTPVHSKKTNVLKTSTIYEQKRTLEVLFGWPIYNNRVARLPSQLHVSYALNGSQCLPRLVTSFESLRSSPGKDDVVSSLPNMTGSSKHDMSLFLFRKHPLNLKWYHPLIRRLVCLENQHVGLSVLSFSFFKYSCCDPSRV